MKIIIAVLIGNVLFFAGHALATASRGYEALGGEVMFLLLIPVVVSLLEEVRE